jgi:hypothetical protein
MAISHELSSEIAAALFTDKERSPREMSDLKEMVLQIHTALEQLTSSRGHEPDSSSDSKLLTKTAAQKP